MEVDFIPTADVKWWEKCSGKDAILKFYQGVKIPFALPGNSMTYYSTHLVSVVDDCATYMFDWTSE